MPGDQDENFDEAEEIINESDETVENLAVEGDDDYTANTEQYDETDDDVEGDDYGDPEELDLEPGGSDEPEPVEDAE
jgi:hypothetical protein